MSLQNMTIGKRIGLGFTVVLVLLAALAAFSYFGVDHLLHDAKGVTKGNHLDAVLAQREIDHLLWTAKLSDFITNAESSELHLETDDHQCGLGKWLYGEGRKEALASFPTLAPILNGMEEPHRQLHESAVEIERTYRLRHPGLAQILADRMDDHIQWVAGLTHALITEAQVNGYTKRREDAVDQAMSIIEAIAEDESIGSEEVRKERALATLKAMRYGTDGADYVWVNDMHPRMIMHPIDSALDGQDLTGITDTQGTPLFMNMVRKVEKDHEGFVVYYWPHPATNEPTEKVSYVRAYAPWGWIVGSGIFVEDADDETVARMRQFADNAEFKLGLQMDPARCEFGKFLSDPATARLMQSFPEFKTAMEAIREPHERLHRAAVDIERLMNEHQLVKAIRVYEDIVKPALDDVKSQIHDTIEAEDQLVRAVEETGEIFTHKSTPALSSIRDLLKKAREEIHANTETDEALVASAESTGRYIMMTGVAAVVIGIFLALFIARGLIRTLTRTVTALREGADQVNDAAGQVAGASQQLAEGASEQASSLEETSSALEEMAAMTRTNAASAREANELSAQARNAADEGDRTMGKLNSAMTSIDESSSQISKIIKVIEEIAFQTNLLALNAAVEAARAGEHGKGFAVVADEVRNLAQRAAQAARETTSLIEDSVGRVREGTQVANEVTRSLGAITGDVAKVSELINGIATASDEQSRGVDQINTAVSQMDKVTQQNASGAEESASAAEELAAQAEAVRSMVNELATLVGGNALQKQAPNTGSPHSQKDKNLVRRRALGRSKPSSTGTRERGNAPAPVTAQASKQAGSANDNFLDMSDGNIQDF
ncbi:MAG: cache domain-containing protein [Phycisphaerae bacterium]|nr:cache domain-containing protein [Phycisphaerae bacterium]